MRRTCQRCGSTHKGRYATCQGCRMQDAINAQLDDPEIALRGGEWVLDRGIRRWRPRAAIPTPRSSPPRSHQQDAPQSKSAPAKGALCDCGCLILQGEDCPACRAWARDDEARWARQHDHGPLIVAPASKAEEHERAYEEAA